MITFYFLTSGICCYITAHPHTGGLKQQVAVSCSSLVWTQLPSSASSLAWLHLWLQSRTWETSWLRNGPDGLTHCVLPQGFSSFRRLNQHLTAQQLDSKRAKVKTARPFHAWDQNWSSGTCATILLVIRSHKSSPDSKGEESDSISSWEKQHGMGEITGTL